METREGKNEQRSTRSQLLEESVERADNKNYIFWARDFRRRGDDFKTLGSSDFLRRHVIPTFSRDSGNRLDAETAVDITIGQVPEHPAYW